MISHNSKDRATFNGSSELCSRRLLVDDDMGLCGCAIQYVRIITEHCSNCTKNGGVNQSSWGFNGKNNPHHDLGLSENDAFTPKTDTVL
jgi:hypothetical protein